MPDHYRALTRTYRPTTFDDIVSQKHVSDTLRNAIKQQRLAHAYMFCGPRGVGKTTMARVLARIVNDIDASVDGEGLNQTLNIVEIDAASNNSVDDIRDLRERVRIPPQNGRYKIYIIDEVHMLSKQAFNALLKTLEEPPDHVIFIFATTEPHKVLPTILSRVQRFDFKRISVDEIVERLQKIAKQEGIKIDVESLHVIAKKADGALRDGLGLLDQAIAFCGSDIKHEELLRALNVVSTDRIFQFMETVENNDAGAGLELINELLQEGYDIQEFLIGLNEHLRNLYVAKNSSRMHLVEASGETKKRYQQSSEAYNQDDLMRMMHIVSEAQFKIKDAHQPRILFEITLLKLIHMERSRNIHALLNGLEELKKKVSKGEVSGSLKSTREDDGSSPAEEEQDSGTEAIPSQTGIARDESGTPGGPEEHVAASGVSDAGTTATTQSGNTMHLPAGSASQVSEPAMDSGDDVAVADNEGEESADFFGQPSLGSFGNASSDNGKGNRNGKRNLEVDSARPTETRMASAADPVGKISLADLEEQWPTYLDILKREVPQTLYFQMQRIDPVKVKNRELTLRCSNDFAKRIIDENKRELAKILETVVGIFLRFRSFVQKTEQETEESKSPYERFKDLQKRDPTIKKLVELFEAELDYNLSR